MRETIEKVILFGVPLWLPGLAVLWLVYFG